MNPCKWSSYIICATCEDGTVLFKNMMTGSVARLSSQLVAEIGSWLEGNSNNPPEGVVQQLTHPDCGMLVPCGLDEHSFWQEKYVDKRNGESELFILHFLPTLACQLNCGYCVQSGITRSKSMTHETYLRSLRCVREYLVSHKEIKSFRMVLFGGEPMLRKDLVVEATTAFHGLAIECGIDFWTEVTTNGELLDEETLKTLSHCNLRRVQVTLDGPESVHNSRRPRRAGGCSFPGAWEAIKMLLETDYIQTVDVRLSLDLSNVESLPELVRDLSELGHTGKVNLSLGLTTPSFGLPSQEVWNKEREIAEKALIVWRVAKECGFNVLREFVVGPWCIAIAKHSVVLQPDGTFQKCFCTAGRAEYNFGSVSATAPATYFKDERFEAWDRIKPCLAEKCPFLPVCGGGCIHDAIVAFGEHGHTKRFCQKELISSYNRGLLLLNYE